MQEFNKYFITPCGPLDFIGTLIKLFQWKKVLHKTMLYLYFYKLYSCYAIYFSSFFFQTRLYDLTHLVKALRGSKTISVSAGAWPYEASRRIAVLCLTTIALLFVRLQIMGSQLPVFTRYTIIIPIQSYTHFV